MSIVYEPKGKAREYSPLAVNLYLQCLHGCKYCYAPSAMQKKRETYFCLPAPRAGILEKLEKELKKNAPKKQVLLSFIGDVYSPTIDNNATTREALKLLNHFKVPVAVLTKGGKRCLQDMDVFKEFGEHFQIGATLTFYDQGKSKEWEPEAAPPLERLEMLKELHENGLKTFVSFEPVIEPDETLKIIQRTIEDNSVDVYKIGKINNFQGIDKKINWNNFLGKALGILRSKNKKIYIKHDLRTAADQIKLYGGEVLCDEYNVN